MKKISGLVVLLLSILTSKAQFADPQVKELVEKAYAKSAGVKINNIKIKQTETDRKTAKQTFLPRAGVNATYTRLNNDLLFPTDMETLLLGTQRLLIKEKAGLPFNSQLPATIKLTPVPPIQDKNIFKVTANTQIILFSGGKVPMALQASRHQENILKLANEKERTQLIVDVTGTFDQLALVLASEQVLKTSENLLQEQSRFVEHAITNGLATPIERQKIELARERILVKQLEFTSNKTSLLEKLHQLTGISITELSGLHPALQPVLLETDSLPETEQTEIKMLNEAITATEFKRKMELTDYIPKIALFGQYEFRKKDLSLLDPAWYAGIRLQWNLFDGFTARNNAEKSSLEKQVYREQQQQITEMYQLAVTKSMLDWKTANQKIIMTKQQVTLAGKVAELITKQYRNGLTTLTELLNAFNDQEKANLDLQNAYYEQRKTAIQLLNYKGILTQYY